jgi:hypothetical protein
MFGGGGGMIASMVLTLKNNALLLKRRKHLKDINDEYRRKSKHTKLKFKKSTPEELKAFHEKVIRDKRRSTIIQISIAVVFVIIAFVFALLVVR